LKIILSVNARFYKYISLQRKRTRSDTFTKCWCNIPSVIHVANSTMATRSSSYCEGF